MSLDEVRTQAVDRREIRAKSGVLELEVRVWISHAKKRHQWTRGSEVVCGSPGRAAE